jgi:enoyl-CoA hydratase/carnithine racemase
VVGYGRALDLLLSNERVAAPQALAIGLVTRVSASPESLLTEVRALAERIAAKPPTATQYAKQAARAAVELELKAGLNLELDLFAQLAPMQDVKEAALAFKEKRAPQFSGL